MGQVSHVSKQPGLRLFNGALGQHDLSAWDSPSDSAFDTVATRLNNRGLSEQQVQVAWLDAVSIRPSVSLAGGSGSDAYTIARRLGDAIRALRVRYPNLRLVYLGSPTYRGYSQPSSVNPEPYGYETALGVQWVVRAAETQRETGVVDQLTGDLSGVWVGWGPYIWTDGATPRSDGFYLLKSMLNPDGVHPNASGITWIVNQQLFPFWQSRCWWSGVC